ncbi:uncharacterized protein [Haliotis asinina]|uniref:uncharacterized protein n=1 Tax=Haliotis asinina TaxID=109174 RepID=UPI0035320810
MLQRNHVYLKEHLDVEKILDELYQREVFSLSEKERCTGKQGLSAQSDELLCILPRKGRKGYDIFLQILDKVQPYIKDQLEGKDSSDSHTASAPEKQPLDQVERLKMEIENLRMEAAQLEKSYVQLQSSHEQLKTSHEQLEKENEMLREQLHTKNQGAAGSDRGGIPDSRMDPGSQLQLDAARANIDWCHVNTDGQLVNSRPATQDRHSGRLRKYEGTCATTSIPLPPSPSTVTPAPCTPQYWETHSRVGVVSEGWGCLVLEVGVVEESQVDSKMYVYLQRRSWCVGVWSCGTHRGSLCTSVWQQGEKGKCYSNTMFDTLGKQATLHYGVVLDVGRGRLAFIDLDREVVSAKVDVEWRESLLPVFSAGHPDLYTVNMKVISGPDITMTDTKKSLIFDALN